MDSYVMSYSSWQSWAKQEVFFLFQDIVLGKITDVDRNVTARCISIINRATDDVLAAIQFLCGTLQNRSGTRFEIWRRLGNILIENCRQSLNEKAICKTGTAQSGPVRR
jgi:hypothetical protein